MGLSIANYLPMQQYHPPIYVLAFCTLLTTLVLIFVGGLVTGTDAGMAVPDWPTTFGDNMFLYPLSQMVSGLLVWIPDDLATNLGQGILTKPIQEALNIDENIHKQEKKTKEPKKKERKEQKKKKE